MTTGEDPRAAPWFPRTLATLAALLAALNLADLLYTPAERAEQVLGGYMLTGGAAQVVTVLHILFFSCAAWGCIARKPFMVWVVIGYCVYVLLAVWIWAMRTEVQATPRATLLFNAIFTVILLVLCRVTYARRAAFNG